MKAEITRIEQAILTGDRRVCADYGDVNGASDRLIALRELPTATRDRGRSIESFETWVSRRLRMLGADL